MKKNLDFIKNNSKAFMELNKSYMELLNNGGRYAKTVSQLEKISLGAGIKITKTFYLNT